MLPKTLQKQFSSLYVVLVVLYSASKDGFNMEKAMLTLVWKRDDSCQNTGKEKAEIRGC